MSMMYFEVVGDVTFSVQVTETDAALAFGILVKPGETGSIKDLNGLRFNLRNPALADGMQVIGYKTDVDREPATLNTKFLNGHDMCLSFNHTDETDSYRAFFILSHETEKLTIEDVFEQDFATSVTTPEQKAIVVSAINAIFKTARNLAAPATAA